VVEEGAQHLAQPADLGRAAVDQHVHVEREADLQIRDAHQHAHHLFGIDVLRARLQHDAHVVGGFVAHVGQQRHLLELDHLGQLLDQLGLGDLVGDLGHHHLPGAAGQFLDLPAGAQAKGAAAGAVGVEDRGARFDDHPAGGKIGAGDQRHQLLVGQVGVPDQRLAALHQLVEVVRRDVGRHADGDAAGAVCQQVREGRRQHDRLFQRAVVIGAEIGRVLGQAFEQGLGGGGQPGLGVAAGGRVVAVDVAEVPLPVDQRVADVEILREAGHRVIDRGVAVRVVIAHHVARDLGRLAEPAGGGEPEFAHRIEDPPVHRLQPVAGVGQRAVHDRRQRVLQIALAQRAAQRLGKRGVERADDWRLFGGQVGGRVGHGLVLAQTGGGGNRGMRGQAAAGVCATPVAACPLRGAGKR